ncbi:hypothetical protein DV532_27250 (plasmid) [Pseudomonas sp. Leaf58]|uniref:hypothetical protein n=1 Tax=Pseudomonas sp. Leaf58 TaxID=1736226 RepID=UPI0006FD4F67|nr:hypothetical protein [Pseudomonas sp. Leaf58]AYG47980.1 hypothetical protein DV532_27250 [Pseudomonas sp. Leaf58]KQN62458.1 hypothetical protein ASF02_09930 [Pseudomonas sp. Leaf58]
MLSLKRNDLEFTTVDGLACSLNVYEPVPHGPDAGLVRLLIEAPGDEYQAMVEQAQYSQKFLGKFVTHFRFCPDWRSHFKVPHEKITQREVVLTTGLVLMIDARIASYVQALCDQGYIVLEARQGSDHPLGAPAFIKFADTIPADLETVWNALGWYNLDNSVIPTLSRGWAHEFNHMFLLILDDWAANDLDLTARRYQLDRVPIPYIPEWPKLPRAALLEQERLVRKEVARLNRLDARATFEDLVGLASGRDTHTLKPLAELQRVLADDPVLPFLERGIKEPAALARGLRWHLRGLAPDLILRKIEVEEALNRRDDLRRQQMMRDRLAKME